MFLFESDPNDSLTTYWTPVGTFENLSQHLPLSGLHSDIQRGPKAKGSLSGHHTGGIKPSHARRMSVFTTRPYSPSCFRAQRYLNKTMASRIDGFESQVLRTTENIKWPWRNSNKVLRTHTCPAWLGSATPTGLTMRLAYHYTIHWEPSSSLIQRPLAGDDHKASLGRHGISWQLSNCIKTNGNSKSLQLRVVTLSPYRRWWWWTFTSFCLSTVFDSAINTLVRSDLSKVTFYYCISQRPLLVFCAKFRHL